MNSVSHLSRPTPGTSTRPTARTWRRGVGIVLAVHAIAHLAGTTQALAAIDDDRGIEALGGLADLDTAATLSVWAAAWALIAAVTAAAALWTLLDRAGARRLVVVAATVSLVACLVGLWPTAIGVAVNVGLLVAARRPIWSDR